MKRTLKFLAFLMCAGCSFFCLSCGDDTVDDKPTGDGKPVIENLAVSPTSVSYSDIIALSGNFSDLKGLQSYTVKLSNVEGEIYEVTKMLTGKTFNLNDNQVIVLPKNAKAGNVTISVTVKNSENNSTTGEVVLQNVKIPVFEKLYLILGTKVCELVKDGDVFVYEELVPAGATGKIYVNADKTGLYWGNQSGVVTTMVDGDFVIGAEAEKALKVTFNPVTFELTVSESEEQWTEINEPLYILGDISGHAWETGEIVAEGASNKMQGYQSGNKKYWTWTPPSLGTDAPDDWWGNMTANPFRFKLGGKEQYILYRNHTITLENGDDKTAAFATSVGGHVNIKVYHDGTVFNKVSIEEITWEDGSVTRSLDYLLDGGLNINGSSVPTALTFAGSPLSLKDGTSYIFEGTVNLENGANITAAGVNLSTANPDPDVFTGKGNATWKVVGNSGNYLVRVDPFASTIYTCQLGGYPNVLYMDGWSWAKLAGDPGIVWNPEQRMSLQRKGTTNTYEGTFHYRGWGGDLNFWYGDLNDPDISKKRFLLSYFDGITTATSLTNLTIPGVGSDGYDGYFKVTVNLQDGFTFGTAEEDGPDGPVFVIDPANGKKFTITFTPVQ
ncbi:MAG: hypothetical protein LBO74_02755 [Candidatus Symbiothrix sp.]|jgi:hypothetical protein|nr:hypothetical protein [Candidatus Symbiothrix sp.]